MTDTEKFEDKIFFSKYKPEKKIGEGSFGKIYSAINIHTNEKFALKLESKSSGQNLLESEAYVLCYLKGVGIPAVKSYGFSGEHNILVMELLGKSLEDIFQDCSCKFSLKTVCMLGHEMLNRIEYVHNRHIIHRDIKPDNFIMGINENSQMVYIIDFGLAKKYRSSRNLQHIKFTNNKKLTGTARYASINALKGSEQSRRDDLEAIGYVLMYFLRGSLPWQGLKVDKKEDRYKKIYEKKKSTTAEELCKGFPNEFVDYINYTRNMGFEQEPDYEYLKNLFKQVMTTNNYTFDLEFDWITKSGSQKNSYVAPPNVNNTNPSAGKIKTNATNEIEKNVENLNLVNSNMYIQTNAGNNNNVDNKPKIQVNTNNNYKFIDTINNNADRVNTTNVKVDKTVKEPELPIKQLQTTANQSNLKENKEGKILQTTGNLNDSKGSKKKKDKDSKCLAF